MNQVFHEAPNAELLQAAATEVLQSRMSEQEATRQAEQHVSRMQNETAQAVNQIRTEATHAVTEAFLSSQSQVAAQTQVEAAQSLAASAQELAQTRSQFEAREQQLLAQIHSLQAAATDARRETDMMKFHSLNVAGKDDETLNAKLEYLHENMCRIDRELQEQKGMFSQIMDTFNILGDRLEQLESWTEDVPPPADDEEELVPTITASRGALSPVGPPVGFHTPVGPHVGCHAPLLFEHDQPRPRSPFQQAEEDTKTFEERTISFKGASSSGYRRYRRMPEH